MGIKLVGILLCLFAPILAARPISYSGGSTIMAFSNAMQDSVYYHYSPSYRFSVGIEAVSDKYTDQEYAYWRSTFLLNRKNTQHSQRNIYLQAGISTQGLDHHFVGVHGDWETRRWFSGFGAKNVKTNTSDYSEKFLQLGVAPYLGEYGDLHTWLMLKSKKDSRLEGWSTYPVLKFFKGNLLLEVGYDREIEWDSHIMYRF
jgi:hypothetical protein